MQNLDSLSVLSIRFEWEREWAERQSMQNLSKQHNSMTNCNEEYNSILFDYDSVNSTLVEAERHVARKWLLLLSNSWTDRALQYCWLITMINRSLCFTPGLFISYRGSKYIKPIGI